MNATALSTARPPRAAIAWATRDNLFVEIPHKDPSLPPYICRYPRTAVGLASALNILIEHAEATANRPLRDINANHPAIKHAKATVPATEDQREAARVLLRKMGLV